MPTSARRNGDQRGVGTSCRSGKICDMDMVFIGIGAAFFAFSFAYLKFCNNV